MGLIKITADMTESERTAVINTNMQYLQLSNRSRKYPIGMIVAFDTDIDPNELYGGTWERIKGRVIWGIDDGETAGCTGGTKEETLTTAQIPSHTHKANSEAIHYSKQHGNIAGAAGDALAGANRFTSSDYPVTQSAGGGQPHNNMMPYYGAYVWRKTGHGIGEDPTLTEYEAFVQQMNTAISEALTKERLITNTTCANALRGNASGAVVKFSDISPNEHTLGVKVRSKNMFDKSIPFDSYIRLDSSYSYLKYYVGVGSNVTVSISEKPTVPNTNGYMYVCPSGTPRPDANAQWLAHQTVAGYCAQQRTVVSTDGYICLVVSSPLAGNPLGYYGDSLQIELGSTATAYTPYISDLTSVTVTRHGKNLFDKDNANIITGYIDANVIKAAPTSRSVYIPCTPNTTYTVSKMVTARFVVAFTDVIPTVRTAITNRVQNYTSTSITATSGADSKYIVVWVYNSAYDTSITLDEILATLQIELGTTATEYEPYKTPTEYTPAADGTVSGVKSLYPTTTLMTDTDGIIIDAEYNRDINKAFAEMQQAIISLGGNV